MGRFGWIVCGCGGWFIVVFGLIMVAFRLFMGSLWLFSGC